jgi:CHRD domain
MTKIPATIALCAATFAAGGLPALADGTGGRPLAAELTPGAEVAPFVGVAGASGSVALQLNQGQGRICIDASTDDFDLVLLHIHVGVTGANGGVVVDLTSLIDDGDAVGCVDVDPNLVKAIRQNPAGYYVNAHQGLPPGAAFFQGLRGQLG